MSLDNKGKTASARVFILDDDEVVVNGVKNEAEKNKWAFLACRMISGTMESLRAFAPDVVLLDLNLPDGEGYEICRQMREESALEKIPVIFLTSKSDLDFKLKGFEAGAQDFIAKPFNMQELVARIRAHLAVKNRQDALQRDLSEVRQLARTRTARPLPGEAGDSKKILAGQYELLRQIGAGGMSVVYEGKDHALDRPVAVKKMRPDIQLTGRDKDLLMKEAKLSASLHHPFIVDIYTVLEEGDDIYIVFEFVDGSTLQEIIDESGPLPGDQVKSVLRCVCDALTYAHSCKVIHRDVKPSNIMLTKQGYAKVMDFGIARRIKDTATRLSATHTGPDASGTLPYMAPEQELGKSDHRSDIFALGVTVYEMLAGALPYLGPNFYAQKEKKMFKPLLEAAPDAPPELVHAAERALSFGAKDRFQSIEEFAKAAGIM